MRLGERAREHSEMPLDTHRILETTLDSLRAYILGNRFSSVTPFIIAVIPAFPSRRIGNCKKKTTTDRDEPFLRAPYKNVYKKQKLIVSFFIFINSNKNFQSANQMPFNLACVLGSVNCESFANFIYSRRMG